jgi:hypothetical protein
MPGHKSFHLPFKEKKWTLMHSAILPTVWFIVKLLEFESSKLKLSGLAWVWEFPKRLFLSYV